MLKNFKTTKWDDHEFLALKNAAAEQGTTLHGLIRRVMLDAIAYSKPAA